MKAKLSKMGEWTQGYNAGIESASTFLRAECYPHLSKMVKTLRIKDGKLNKTKNNPKSS